MNQICKCGHINKYHVKFIGDSIFCINCNIKDIDSQGYFLSFHNFKADNLKYLESIYEQKL